MTKITPEIIRELTYYNPDTGIMVWRERSLKWFSLPRYCNAWNARYAGQRIGRVWTNCKTGYQRREAFILGRCRIEHRLVWMYMTGELAPPQIDHLDRDATNNKWKNLVESKNQDNQKNKSMLSSNTSGYTGVSWSSASNKWQASYHLNGKQTYLGLFPSKEDAFMAVQSARLKSGYTVGHGEHKAGAQPTNPR